MKAVAIAVFLLLTAPFPGLAAEITTAQHLKTVPLVIRTQAATRRYRVEVARSPEQQEIGLMFRKAMARDHGMIFPMVPQRYASFWMRNTLIPLDLIFIRKDGTISSIAPNATPLSLDQVQSLEPIAAVLELVGGEAQRSGIRAGDRVRW